MPGGFRTRLNSTSKSKVESSGQECALHVLSSLAPFGPLIYLGIAVSRFALAGGHGAEFLL